MSEKKSTSGIVYDSDDGVLLSGFEEDSDVKRYFVIAICSCTSLISPRFSPVKKGQFKGKDKNALKYLSNDDGDDELGSKTRNDVFLEDYGTRYVPSHVILYVFQFISSKCNVSGRRRIQHRQ